MKRCLRCLLCLTLIFSISCGDDLTPVDQNGEPLPEGVTKKGDTFTDGMGRTCSELTPCMDCDETCKPAGNPFASKNNGQSNNNGSNGSTTGVTRGTNNGSSTGGDTVCSELDVTFSTPVATVVLLIDQSGSMDEDFGQGQNRFEATYDVLMNPADGLVVQFQDDYRFGFSLYTSFNGGPTCPELSDVKPSLNNFGPIDTVFSQAKPEDDTPTGESIRGVMRMYEGFDDGPHILLLATDGLPDSCDEPDGGNGDIPKQLTLDATKDAFAVEKVSTFILSVGTAISDKHLQEVANLGVGMAQDGSAGNAPFFSANNTDDLKSEMKKIITQSRGCIFKLDGAILDLALIDRGQVTVNGMNVTYQDANGFVIHQDPLKCFGSKQCLELTGSACEAVASGAVSVNGRFICVYDDPIPGDDPTTPGETPGMCKNPGEGCLYSGDCCSGLCTGFGGSMGQCIVQ